MDNIFVLIDRFFKKHRLIFWCSFLLSFAIPGFIAMRIHLEEDISSIIPSDDKTKQLNEIFQQSKLLDKMILTVSSKDSTNIQPDSLVVFADEFAATAGQILHPYVKEIAYDVKEESTLQLLQNINDNLPVFLEPQDYIVLDSQISASAVKANLEKNYRTLSSPAGLALKQFIAKDLAGISSPALKRLQLLQYDQNFELYDNHIVTRDHKKLVLFITPAFPKNNTGKNAIFLKQLDQVLDSLQRIHPGIKASYFGGTAVAVGNAVQLRKDTLFTQGITVVFLILFLALYFRRAIAPLLILVPAVFGAVFSLAIITLIKGSVSVIALGTGSVILGIAVNYSLHVFNHFRHQPDMEEVLKDLSKPMTIGSITTIGGFFCLLLVESAMLKDLGLFAGFSLIGASLCSLVFLPQLIRMLHTSPVQKHSWLDKIAGYQFEANKKLVLLVAALTVFFAFFINRVEFEPDMNRMNFMSPGLRQSETEVNQLNAFALQSIYLVSSGRNLEEALRRNEKATEQLQTLQENQLIKKYSGLTSILISDSLQRVRIDQWNKFWTPEKKQELLQNLLREGKAIGFNEKAFIPVQEMLNRNYSPVSVSSINALESGMTDNYIIHTDTAVKVLTLVKAVPEHKKDVYAAFNGLPAVSVLDMQYVTGRLVDIVQKDFSNISWMAAGIVFVVLFISFGRIELTLIAFIPMLISWIWILGIMGLTGIRFNIINIIISALIFGLGDDYSLFTIDGLLQEYKTGKKNLGSFRSSIFLSAITTVAGLGVLIFAEHPSLKSIALIAITGILCVVLISQILIPILFKLLISGRTEKGKPPFTLWSLITSTFAFFYFVAGALLLTVAGLLLISLNPFAGKQCRYIFHVLLSKFVWGLMYIMGNVKKTVINPTNELFTKPAVIICNHQSFLDILSLIMLHPKIILLTKEWVWNSPVFGFVVRMAGYLPVTERVESNLTLMQQYVDEGYSIAVFPEGTRSPDGKMKRFHKGAFYLAEQLQLDILPILLHGTGYAMGKGDFMLKDAHINIEILPRIHAADERFGNSFGERAKLISRYFKSAYQQRRETLENTTWYKNQLIANYIYKGPVLEWYMRIKTRMENYYSKFDSLVPRQGRILDLGCGYGFMSYMLQFTSEGRDLTGVDYDEEKIATANHCFSKNDRIRFIQSDATQFEIDRYDAILICDMLHYLQPKEQDTLIEKCMDRLNPGGRLLIREGNTEITRRHRITKLSEFFSTRLLGFNKTSTGGLSFLSGERIRNLAKKNSFECAETNDNFYTSNVIFVLDKQQPAI
jgi:1-acyl-sn-glycerol-3-phosphate acyltransferase